MKRIGEYAGIPILEDAGVEPGTIQVRRRYPCEIAADASSRLDRLIDEKRREIAAMNMRRHYQEDRE